MRLFVIATLFALLFPLATGYQDGGNLINAVLGNTPGVATTADDVTRIRAHLHAVIERLERADTRTLTPGLRRARARNIERLVEYAQAGRFPSNPPTVAGRAPNFLDDTGARCAVGYLVEQDLGFEAVQEINREHQFDYVPYIDSPGLASWQTTSGLTPLELAMIQPTYGGRGHEPRNGLDQLGAIMDDLEARGFSGQVVVRRGNQSLLDKSYGSAEENTGFEISSVTQAFTAAAIFRLVRDHRLSLLTTLGSVMPDVPVDKQDITIENLLTHTSGLGNTHAADGEADRVKAMDRLLVQPLAHKPGEKFTYSDDGYVMLAAIIELASGMTYEQYMDESVINAQEMRHTGFWGKPGVKMAAFSSALPPDIDRPQWGQRGSGGIVSTARDLCYWAWAFLGGQIVPSDAVEAITKAYMETDQGVGIGCGWFRMNQGKPSSVLFTRGNDDFGHSALIEYYPNQETILVVTSNVSRDGIPGSQLVERALSSTLTFP